MINDEGKAFRASSNRCYLHEKIDSIYSLFGGALSTFTGTIRFSTRYMNMYVTASARRHARTSRPVTVRIRRPPLGGLLLWHQNPQRALSYCWSSMVGDGSELLIRRRNVLASPGSTSRHQDGSFGFGRFGQLDLDAARFGGIDRRIAVRFGRGWHVDWAVSFRFGRLDGLRVGIGVELVGVAVGGWW